MLRYISGANGNSGDDALLSEDGESTSAPPEDVQAVFADIDANGDGVLDMEEFKTMLSTYAVLQVEPGGLRPSRPPRQVQPALCSTRTAMAPSTPRSSCAPRALSSLQEVQKRMRKFIIGLVLFVIALIGINSAMTFMMVELGRDQASPTASSGQHRRRNQGLCREPQPTGNRRHHSCSS